MTPWERARLSLEGLSVGDAFGQTYFANPDSVEWLIQQRALANPPWTWTDDTMMALSVVESLGRFREMDQEYLAQSFADHYEAGRSYGPAMHGFLRELREGGDWRGLSRGLFEGQGSFGNGAAMRVAPLGAYFADDLPRCIQQARLSAEVTHTHAEGIAGAIAVAVAAALAWQARSTGRCPSREEFLDSILPHVPDSIVREKIRHARELTQRCSVSLAVAALGNGSGVSAQDTVPFCLWCAGESLEDYEEALWRTLSGLGDRDTTCAIVGGIVSLYTGAEGIPDRWKADHEPLPDWPFSSSAS